MTPPFVSRLPGPLTRYFVEFSCSAAHKRNQPLEIRAYGQNSSKQAGYCESQSDRGVPAKPAPWVS